MPEHPWRRVIAEQMRDPEFAAAWAEAEVRDALEADLRRAAEVMDPVPPPLIEAARRARFDDGLPCCDMHNRFCEPPSDLCCHWCAEVAHPGHLDGSACVIGRNR